MIYAKSLILHVILCGLLATSGCGQRAEATLGLGGYWYVLPQPNLDYYTIGSHGVYWETRKWTLKVDEHQYIYFNGNHLGQMQKNDELRVTWEGVVYHNGNRIDKGNTP